MPFSAEKFKRRLPEEAKLPHNRLIAIVDKYLKHGEGTPPLHLGGLTVDGDRRVVTIKFPWAIPLTHFSMVEITKVYTNAGWDVSFCSRDGDDFLLIMKY